MIEIFLKRLLRKWLKKKLNRKELLVKDNERVFLWVYNSPIKEWKDRIWVAQNSTIHDTQTLSKRLSYIHS